MKRIHGLSALVFLVLAQGAAAEDSSRIRRSDRLVKVAAEQDFGGRVAIRWTADRDAHNLGFNIYRQLEGGALEKVNPHLIAGAALFAGDARATSSGYQWSDQLREGRFAQYWIEDVSLDGSHRMRGPVTPAMTGRVVATNGTDTLADLGSNGGILVSPRGIGAPAFPTGRPTKQQLAQQWDLSAQPAAKLLVTGEGWYRLTKGELASAGFDAGTSSRSLALFVEGVEQPVVVNDGGDGKFDLNDSIEFYGIGIDTLSSGARPYWLVKGKGNGLRARSERNRARVPAATDTRFTFERIERTVFFAALVNNGEAGNFFGPVIGTWGTTQQIAVENIARAGGTAQLELVIQGVTAGDHVVQLAMNGHALDDLRLTDQHRLAATIDVPLSAVLDGPNELGLVAAGGSQDLSVVESLRLTYSHRLVADGDGLKVQAGPGTPVTIEGFSSSSVRAIDVTDAMRPVHLAVEVSSSGGAYRASFVTPDGGERSVLVLGASRHASPAQIVANEASAWNEKSNAADLVILTPRPLSAAAQPLAARRESEGIRTVIVDVEDLYDEFGFGVRGPEAIRAFLSHTREWKTPPRYVLLVGDATFDPRNYLGMGTFDLVPTRLVPTEFLKTSSDDWLADWTGTGLPELAIGRLPARSLDEARMMIDPIVARGRGADASGAWSDEALFIADGTNDYEFEQMTESLRRLLPGDVSPVMLNAGEFPDAKTAILSALESGQLLATFVGHGSVEFWIPGAIHGWDVAQLTNGERRPVLFGMTCLNGYFHDLYQQSMAEAFLTNPNGGAIAVWTSSTLTYPEGQMEMAREAFRNLFKGTLGDALVRAKAATSDVDVRRSWMLFGDPSMRVR